MGWVSRLKCDGINKSTYLVWLAVGHHQFQARCPRYIFNAVRCGQDGWSVTPRALIPIHGASRMYGQTDTWNSRSGNSEDPLCSLDTMILQPFIFKRHPGARLHTESLRTPPAVTPSRALSRLCKVVEQCYGPKELPSRCCFAVPEEGYENILVTFAVSPNVTLFEWHAAA